MNLEKSEYEKCQPLLVRRHAPAPYFHSPFFKIQILSSGEGNQNLLPTPLKKGGGGLNYVSFHTSCLISVIVRKKAFSVVSSGLGSDFYPPLSCSHIYIYIYIKYIYIKIYVYIIYIHYIFFCKPMQHAN